MADAQTVNPDEHSRPELNQLALDAGLTDLDRYPNKPAVADAINRVRSGEDASAVSAELAPNASSQDNTTPTASDQPEDAADAPRSSKRKKSMPSTAATRPSSTRPATRFTTLSRCSRRIMSSRTATKTLR